jgi:pyruvate formate lyase activating enzyme
VKNISRRRFLYCSAAFLSTALPAQTLLSFSGKKASFSGAADIRGRVFKGDGPDQIWKWSKEGFLYKKLKGDKVVCGVCPNRCILAKGDRSVCRSKTNIDGVMYSLTYGNPCAANIDPVEKKPLYHFRPRTTAFSIATAGCNFRCLNCQNYEISQAKPHEVRTYELFPEDAVKEAQRADAASIAYTYSEPITFFEYMIDTARLANKSGIHNLLISNGYINRKPLLALCEVLDGANINLKSIDDEIYRKLNGGRLQPVLNTFKTLHAQGVHFEMTNLVVPGYVDDPDMVKRMCDWILTNVGTNYPLHFLRFFPRYKLDRLPPTPISTLEQLREIALAAGIRYVYLGNVPKHKGNNTYCHNCGKLLIQRLGYFIPTFNMAGSKCKFCDTTIPGVWEEAEETSV